MQYKLRSIGAYLLKKDFQQFCEYVSPYYAGMASGCPAYTDDEIQDRINEEDGQDISQTPPTSDELVAFAINAPEYLCKISSTNRFPAGNSLMMVLVPAGIPNR